MALISTSRIAKLISRRISGRCQTPFRDISWSSNNSTLPLSSCLDNRGGLSSLQIFGSTRGKAFYSSSKDQKQEEEELDKPIKFSTSKAAKWSSFDSLNNDPNPDSPDWQPYVVIVSVASFLLWFCVFREENDFDEEMSRPLWERVPNLERQQLDLLMQYNRANNLPTDDLEKRMKELMEEDAIRKKNAAEKTK